MRTAIISDLHLGAVSCEDLAGDLRVRQRLFDELADVDRLVLLGDTFELRDVSLLRALHASRPFFDHLHEALPGSASVVVVPGNHDYSLAAPVLAKVARAGRTLGLDDDAAPAVEPWRTLRRWMGERPLSLRYPGVWLRDDVYATHGHYLDCHRTFPSLECIAISARMHSIGAPPEHARPLDYERVLAPVYSVAAALARPGLARRAGGGRFSERVWHAMHAGGDGANRVSRAVRRATFGALAASNRMFGSAFEPDLSPDALQRATVAGAHAMATSLRIRAAHVVVGHTHLAGRFPNSPGAPEIHMTGSWFFARPLRHLPLDGGPFWPGTVTWLDDGAAPRLVSLLSDRSSADLLETVRGRVNG